MVLAGPGVNRTRDLHVLGEDELSIGEEPVRTRRLSKRVGRTRESS